MTRINLRATSSVAALLLATSGLLMASSGAKSMTQTDNKADVSTLLRGIESDAATVQARAREVEHVAEEPAPTYKAYDRLWNDMAPCIEDMSLKMDQLQHMPASATSSEQKTIDHSATLISQISSDSTNFRTFLNDHSNDLTNPTFKKDGESLAKDASTLITTVGIQPANGNMGTATSTGTSW